MESFKLLASPWWVNLAVAIPFMTYLWWRKNGLAISRRKLGLTGVFAIAFALVEAATVVYLRIAAGFPLSNDGGLTTKELTELLGAIEMTREAATMVMLAAVAVISARGARERLAIFLWTFAIWDIFYYLCLWFMIRWPQSLTSPDVFFLIPVPWVGQVWFPILVSGLIAASVLTSRK